MKISDKAKDYIQQKGSVVTIDFSGIGGCCAPLYIPVAELKKPEDPNSYMELHQDGISVYYPIGAVIDDKAFGIDLISFNFHSCLEVVGIDRQS